MQTNKKAQGTIEYLVIIAVVVVIALIVVGILLQLMGQGSGIPQVASQTVWKSDQPWAIVDWKQTTTTLTLVLKNNSSDAMDFTDIYITSSNSSTTGVDNVAPNAKIEVLVNVPSCTAGVRYSYPKSGIYIDYNSSTIAGKRQNAIADLVGTCS